MTWCHLASSKCQINLLMSGPFELAWAFERPALQTTSPRFALQKEQEDEVTQKDYCYSDSE